MQNNIQLRSTQELFQNPAIPNIAVNQFGSSVYGIIDVKTTLFGAGSTSAEFEEFIKEQSSTTTDYSRTIDDTAWEKLMEEESDEELNYLNSYFSTRKITDKNDYTGVFEDKNLIIVMMESVNNLIIDKEKYPTIYKMYSEGWSWDNAYSPRNSCSTGNNEMSGVISLFTVNNSCTANRYKDNTYPQSIYNLFNNQNYYTSSYHNFDDTYYYRNTYHYNFGSQNYMDVYKLGIERTRYQTTWPSDIELIEKSLPNFIDEENFFSFIITVSSHHPYNNYAEVSTKYASLYPDAESNALKSYYSKLTYVDKGLETLLTDLDEANKLDDTIIVLYADHYPYAFNTYDLQKAFDYDIDQRKEVDRTPFIIYNTEIEPKKFKEYTTFMNITPTLANLFDLDYDPRLYAGEDILSDDYSGLAIFADGSWQSKVAYYEATTGTITYMGNLQYSQEQIIQINKSVSNKIAMSNTAIKRNYFEYLFNGLKKYNQEDEIPNNKSIE